jgi:hypothetical protein
VFVSKEVNNERNIGIVLACSMDLLDNRVLEYLTRSRHSYEGCKMTEQATTEGTYFLPFSGLDAANYLVIASQVKVAAHEDVSVEHLHFVDDLRQIIILHKLSLRTEFTEDGFFRKSTSPEVIAQMVDLLARLRHEGLRLYFRMWSVSTAQELVRNALKEAEALDNDGNPEETQRQSDSDGYGAIVAFLIVPECIPMLIHDYGNSHTELCMSQVPDWQSLPNVLAGA